MSLQGVSTADDKQECMLRIAVVGAATGAETVAIPLSQAAWPDAVLPGLAWCRQSICIASVPL